MSHIDHQAQPSTKALTCLACRSPVAYRGLCLGHAKAADAADEYDHFLGYHATDERVAAWLGVKPDSVERERMRRKAGIR